MTTSPEPVWRATMIAELPWDADPTQAQYEALAEQLTGTTQFSYTRHCIRLLWRVSAPTLTTAATRAATEGSTALANAIGDGHRLVKLSVVDLVDVDDED